MESLVARTKLFEIPDDSAADDSHRGVDLRDSSSSSKLVGTSTPSGDRSLGAEKMAGEAVWDHQHASSQNSVECQDTRSVRTMRYPRRQSRIAATNHHRSAWQRRLRPRENVNYEEVDELEDEEYSSQGPNNEGHNRAAGATGIRMSRDPPAQKSD